MDEIPENAMAEFQPFIPQKIEFSLETVEYSIPKNDDRNNKKIESPYPSYEITNELIIRSFYCFFQAVQNEDIQQIIQCLEDLRFYSKHAIFPYFDEFMQYDIPSLLINLFSLDIKTFQDETHHKNQNQEDRLLEEPEKTVDDQFENNNPLLIEQKITFKESTQIQETDLNEEESMIDNPIQTHEEDFIEKQPLIIDQLPNDTIVIEDQFTNEYYETGFSKEESSDEEFFSNEDQQFSEFDFSHQEPNLNEQQNSFVTELTNQEQHSNESELLNQHQFSNKTIFLNQDHYSTEQKLFYKPGIINQEDFFNDQQRANETIFCNIQSTNEIKQKIDISLIRFVTELGKNKNQGIFDVIVQDSFHENLIKVAYEFFNNEILICRILQFYKKTINNFSYTHEHILMRETLDLFRKIMLNLEFKKETRLMPIEIFTLYINNKNHLITSIQQDQIIIFLISFFNDQRSNETLWSSFLTFFKSMIIDQQSFNRIMDKIQDYLLKFLAENQTVGAVAMSISILNLRFKYCENPIDVFNPSIHFSNLFKYAMDKNDSLSYASLSMIYNIMHYSPELFIQCLEMNIVDILLFKLDNASIKTQKQALRILALIVSNGDIETHKHCIELNFIERFLSILEYDNEDFMDLAIPALLTLLQVSFKEPGYLFNWERFDAQDGMTTIEDLQTSSIHNVCLKAPGLLEQIIEMRTQLQI